MKIVGKCPGEYLNIRGMNYKLRMLSADELLDLRKSKTKLSLGLIN
jgi:hypothetical protein